MNNEVLAQILAKKEITINDDIKFRVILDVLSSLFTDENHISILEIGYRINDSEQIWFPNIIPNNKKAAAIKDGYGNFLSEDGNYLYQFDSTKPNTKRISLGEKYQQKQMKFVTFAKINEKSKGIGFHFVGVFAFEDYQDQDPKTMIYKKISDSYKIRK